MLQMIQEGGGGIWPVITFSLAALVVVVMFVIRPSKARRALVHGSMALVLASAALGAVSGIQGIAREVRALEQLPQFVVGVGEALHLLVLAGIVTVVVLLIATIGNYRLAERDEQLVTESE